MRILSGERGSEGEGLWKQWLEVLDIGQPSGNLCGGKGTGLGVQLLEFKSHCPQDPAA